MASVIVAHIEDIRHQVNGGAFKVICGLEKYAGSRPVTSYGNCEINSNQAGKSIVVLRGVLRQITSAALVASLNCI